MRTTTFRVLLNKITHQVRVGPVQRHVPDNPVLVCVFVNPGGNLMQLLPHG